MGSRWGGGGGLKAEGSGLRGEERAWAEGIGLAEV